MQTNIFEAHVSALKDSKQVQSDETLNWRLSAIDMTIQDLDSDQTYLRMLQSEAEVILPPSWLSKIKEAVAGVFAGWKLPLCRR